MNLRKSLIVLLSLLVVIPSGKPQHQEKNSFISEIPVTDGNWGKVSGGPNRSLTDMNHIFGHGYMFICAAPLYGRLSRGGLPVLQPGHQRQPRGRT